MRHLCQLLIAVVFTTSLYGQTDNNKSHFLRNPTVFAPIDITKLYTKEGLVEGNNLTLDTVQTYQELRMVESDSPQASLKKIMVIDTVFKKPITIDKGFAYSIIQEVGTFTIIKFWPLAENKGVSLLQSLKPNKENDAQELSTNFDTLKSLRIVGLKVETKKDAERMKDAVVVFDLTKSFYLVKTSILKANSTDFENKSGLWNIGLLVLPIKIRPWATEQGQFDFADGFSVGTTFSWTVHHNWKTNFTHNFLLFVGISSYTADSSKLKEQRNDYKISAFSPAIGWMWEKNNVQLSFLTGIDFPSGNLQQKWVYRNKPWLGVGVGIGLFKIGNESNTAKQSN